VANPIWWSIPAHEHWWTDLNTYRDSIIDEVTRAVDGLSAALAVAATVTIEGSTHEDS
jgi:hypothetical protein